MTLAEAVWKARHRENKIIAVGRDNMGTLPQNEGDIFKDDVAGSLAWLLNVLVA